MSTCEFCFNPELAEVYSKEKPFLCELSVRAGSGSRSVRELIRNDTGQAWQGKRRCMFNESPVFTAEEEEVTEPDLSPS